MMMTDKFYELVLELTNVVATHGGLHPEVSKTLLFMADEAATAQCKMTEHLTLAMVVQRSFVIPVVVDGLISEPEPIKSKRRRRNGADES